MNGGRPVPCDPQSRVIPVYAGEQTDWERVVEQAGRTCYEAKRQGRNQVPAFSKPPAGLDQAAEYGTT